MFDWFKGKKGGISPTPAEKGKPIRKKESRDEIVATAMENARRAREAIGQETLDRIAEAMRKQQEKKNSPMEQAKKILQEMDKAELADHLRALRGEDKPTRH